MKTAYDVRSIYFPNLSQSGRPKTARTAKKTKPKLTLQPDPAKTLGQQLGQLNRQQWISEAAYYKAEARGFRPGYASDDWLEAEQEYREMVVQLFLTVFEEDGVTVTGLQQLAKAIGVSNAEVVDSKLELVRLIQSTCHHEPCFRTIPGEICPHQDNCQWQADCQKLMAEWWC